MTDPAIAHHYRIKEWLEVFESYNPTAQDRVDVSGAILKPLNLFTIMLDPRKKAETEEGKTFEADFLVLRRELLESILYIKRTDDPEEIERLKKEFDKALDTVRAMFVDAWGYPE